ncbi:GNAT family N-acetyltransferase [Yeosuana sp.]|uniref:GNAT family N-acetyltransferase n=1 Tax=Yeosuana sp. TaxID=2529388 RepID=UPI004054E5CB|tara:strand:+ start:4057 stop:4539 length:483 start_codon:yes stop_codon:yes gene_type:complete
MIRNVQISDAQQILDIYNYYVVNTVITFDIEAVSLKSFTEKIKIISLDYPFIVYEEHNEILGYAYGSRFRPKPAYNHTVESTIYIKQGQHGKQIGTELYKELLQLLKQDNFHMVLGVLTLPNEASVKLHEKFGFKQVAYLKEAGFKFENWQDVGFYQLTF